eukprot:TRINITY_DN66494_c3_g1_i1.p1 TRINITY_DN66494_c3_g1~~TRINITY_DN66494_c3_g1_i1.p1  ORF type:complete len:682 (-),score=86.92 TRINITY_DN66494_c3_g1_i1:302-2347(-)
MSLPAEVRRQLLLDPQQLAVLWPHSLDKLSQKIYLEDTLSDISDEEDPLPGKYMGGKNGKKLKSRTWESLKKPKRPAPQGANQVAPNMKNAIMAVYMVRSAYGLPPTIMFHHEFAKNPARLQLPVASVQLAHHHRLAGLFFKIGPGAVAFRVVLNMFTNSGMKHTHHPTKWNVLWAKRVQAEEWSSLTEYQKVNHFPGTRGIARKDSLYTNIEQMQKRCGFEHFNFVPRTFILPAEAEELQQYMEQTNNEETFIVKPAAGSCGRGIHLIKEMPSHLLERRLHRNGVEKEPKTYVVQHYIGNPLLIDGYKFDIRLYVLVTCFDPLRLYIFNEGLVRFATEQYGGENVSLDNQFMHLTNYSVNKKSAKFVNPSVAKFGSCSGKGSLGDKDSSSTTEGGKGEGEGEDEEDDEINNASKWRITELKKWCEKQGLNWPLIFERITDVVVKTFLSVEAITVEQLRQYTPFRNCCFELFGFDLMIDANLKVWLIEVNVQPSLACSSPMDKDIKYTLVRDTLTTAGPIPYHRGLWAEQVLSSPEAAAAAAAVANGTYMPIGPSNFIHRSANPAQADGFTSTSSLPPDDKELLPTLGVGGKLVIKEAEDELLRCGNFTRVFPSVDSDVKYGKFFQSPRPNNYLMARWEREKRKWAHPSTPSNTTLSAAPATNSSTFNMLNNSTSTTNTTQ